MCGRAPTVTPGPIFKVFFLRGVVCDNGQSIQQNEGSGFACGGGTQALAGGAKDAQGDTHRVRDTGGVTGEHQGTVGPYETATLKDDDPAALSSWLKAHS